MVKDHIGELLSRFGPSGLPAICDDSLAPTWESYRHQKGSESTPKERILSVLGFLHLMAQAGVKTEINPYKAYEAVIMQDFDKYAEILARELRKTRVFDLFKIYKTHFAVDIGLRNNREICISLCLVPKRAESLDSALHKAEGFLYQREVPVFLREKWRRMNIKSKAIKPKSALPSYLDLMKSSSLVGRLPLYISEDCSLHASRAAKDMLVLRFRVIQPSENVSWLNKHAHTKLLQRIWINSVKNIRG